MEGFWEFVSTRELEPNPYRAGFLQLVTVSETDAKAEEEYYEHIRYFYDKSLHVAPEFFLAPGHVDYRSMEYTLKRGLLKEQNDTLADLPNWKYKDFIDNQLVISGSPASVRDQLEEAVKKLRVGNLMVLLQIGSMPHELTLKNIDLFAREVLPHLRNIWDDEGWENEWWPQKLRGKRQLPTTAGG
jgi:alkanesulfonate monooxygenase SsuD/methylene tetrahydromethanopterin reductase-like flavin-dependent oxidoreductase (luciferase family)